MSVYGENTVSKPVCFFLAAQLLLPAVAMSGERVDLLITGGTVVTLDDQWNVFVNGFVAIRDAKIVAIGDASSRNLRDFQSAEILDARNKVVLPGLINTHTHLPMVLFRGLADDLKLDEWLSKHIFPAESRFVTREFVVAGTRLALAEMIRGGTTTYCDMYYFEDAIAEETSKAGLRAVLGQTVIDFPAPDNKTWSEAITSVEAFAGKWKQNELIQPAIAPHAVYTVSTEHLTEVSLLAEKLNLPIVIHLAEASSETDYTLKHYGQRPVSYLEQIGLLSPRVIGAHAIEVNNQELQILRRREVGICHCPQSNMKLAVGVAPIPQMLAAGLRVGLGTDGAASNNDLDLWQEIDTAAKLHKLHTGDATIVSARQALQMATLGGARALHLEERIGSLEVGKMADLIILELDAPHLVPRYDIYSLLVYSAKASDVVDTIVNGRILMRDRQLKTLDIKQVIDDARQYARRVRKPLESAP
jgi:5-methylthioadenosine/S-adenosylhomocysteine deaminase